MIGSSSYISLTTKIRAMKKALLSPSDLKHLAESPDLSSAIQKLREFPGYQEILSAYDTEDLHRRDLEKILNLAKFRDFTRLYRFCYSKQRAFLKFYFMKYELALLQRCLRRSMKMQAPDFDLKEYADFFQKHSKLHFEELLEANSPQSFVESLKQSMYYPLLDSLYKKGNTALFEYELRMNLFYFKTIWHKKDKFVSKKERELLASSFGTELDLLNLQWIYRSKKYYSLPDSALFSLLIPTYHRLKKNEVKELVQAASMEEFEAAFSSTYYGKLSGRIFEQIPNIERLHQKLIYKIYLGNAKKNPYSLASLNLYLLMKDREVESIINTIESIRYSLPPEQIIKDILNIEEGPA
ncbi:MAG: V-type ATPase subunit [Johnsonella sp.]|nr:V-type ATPase subunit [Johnsonella sp.]